MSKLQSYRKDPLRKPLKKGREKHKQRWIFIQSIANKKRWPNYQKRNAYIDNQILL